MYWCAHKTATLTSIQHTVPALVTNNEPPNRSEAKYYGLVYKDQRSWNVLGHGKLFSPSFNV